jgi:ABC-type Fe3+ transport system permease subunit
MNARGHRLEIALLMLPAVGFVAVFLSAVLAMTVMQSVGFFSFSSKTNIDLSSWIGAATGQTWDSFFYSAKIAAASSFGSLLIAYPLALYLRRQFIGRSFLNAIIRVPLFVPALVAAFLVLNVLSFHGILNEGLMLLGIISEPLRLTHDDWGLGVVLIQIWKNLPSWRTFRPTWKRRPGTSARARSTCFATSCSPCRSPGSRPASRSCSSASWATTPSMRSPDRCIRHRCPSGCISSAGTSESGARPR